MKRKLLPLPIIVGALSLSGCSFFDIVTSSGTTSQGSWSGEKQALTYTQEDLNDVYYHDYCSFMPTTGTPKLLVLPVAFTDSSDFIDEEDKVEIKENLQKVCFGTTEDTGWHSINSYYLAESYGKCNIQGEVADWYTCAYSYDRVTTSDYSDKIAQAAVDNWKTNNPDKVSSYDTDGDGYIDGVIIVYGGPNYGNSSILGRHRQNENMWAYTTWLSTSANTESPNPNVYIWASYDFMEKDTSNGVLIDGHTYIHEMGHVMGLDDYYDYAKKGEWAGGYSMQDYNVGGHDPYSMMAFGWVDPYVPTCNATITINSFESSGDVILLSPDFSSNSAFDEYILLELYTPNGVNEHDSRYQYNSSYPKGPTKPGIRIWHVDSRLLKITSSTKRGKTSEYYSITNTIDPTEGSYIVGCTNTTYTGNRDTDAYTSLASELRKYKLLQLIRCGDYTGSYTNEILTYDYLFTEGDEFSLTTYYGYFENLTRLNNGSSLDWNVTINSVSSTSASITVTKE